MWGAMTRSEGREAWVAEALALGTATLGECGALRLTRPPHAMWVGAAVAGRAVTITCRAGDNLAVHVAVAGAGVGDVLVVTVGDEPEFGYWGEVLTVAAQARGVAGLVIDGCVRDLDALEARRFPVFARGVALPGAAKAGPGAVGPVVELGGVMIATGDGVVADRDGVIVMPSGETDTILAAGGRRARREQEMFAALASGATTVQLLGLDVDPIDRSIDPSAPA
jgi:4-hydroxy-4-methyl-2-oxoglutarate aldolase